MMAAPHPSFAEYEEEAGFYVTTLTAACDAPPRTWLELGSGGDNNASHLKRRFDFVLVDPSPGILTVSRAPNPECEHVQGDMRTVRLGRVFDAVFIHDAVAYMTTESDLQRVIETTAGREERRASHRTSSGRISGRRRNAAATTARGVVA